MNWIAPLKPILWPVGPSTAYVPLGETGLFSLIDSEDIGIVSSSNWSLFRDKSTKVPTFYAYGNIRGSEPRKKVFMHRLLLGSEVDGFVVDHKNQNGLDNRRSANLRRATLTQNAGNRKPQHSQRLPKGVSQLMNAPEPTYIARIHVKRKARVLGTRRTPEAAHELYKLASIEIYGEFSPYFIATDGRQ